MYYNRFAFFDLVVLVEVGLRYLLLVLGVLRAFVVLVVLGCVLLEFVFGNWGSVPS